MKAVWWRRRSRHCAASCLFILLLASLPSASSHGEGGPEIRQGILTIRPASLGGTGYNETQFGLANGDAIQYSWSVNDPAVAEVEFNVHGHLGAEVRIFNRTTGQTGKGWMVSPAQMIVALMWRSTGTEPVNVSYTYELRHVPDLYSAAFLTANLAGLMVLFVAVWELSVRGRRKVEEAASDEEGGKNGGQVEKKSAKAGSVALPSSTPASSRRGFFSSWKRRAVLYAVAFLLCSAPLISYFARGDGPPGSDPMGQPTLAFVAHDGAANLTVVDPVYGTPIGEIRLSAPAVVLATNPARRTIYAFVDTPDRIEFVDPDTLVVRARAEVRRDGNWAGLQVPSDGSALWAFFGGNIEKFDPVDGKRLGNITSPGVLLPIGFADSGTRVAALNFANPRPDVNLLVFDSTTFAQVANTTIAGMDYMSSALSPSGKLLATSLFNGSGSLELREVSTGKLLWDLPRNVSVHFEWSPDEKLILIDRHQDRLLDVLDAADGTLLGSIATESDWNSWAVIPDSKTIYLTGVGSPNVTAVSLSSFNIVSMLPAGPAGSTVGCLVLDSEGSYTLATLPSTGELITFHDSPALHYHSRMQVGPGASLCVLLEPR